MFPEAGGGIFYMSVLKGQLTIVSLFFAVCGCSNKHTGCHAHIAKTSLLSTLNPRFVLKSVISTQITLNESETQTGMRLNSVLTE